MAWRKVSKTNPPRRRVIVLRSVRLAQLRLLDKIVEKMIEERKTKVREIIEEINRYGYEKFKILNEEENAITFQFEANEVNMIENGILTGNRVLVQNEEDKVYISVPKIIGGIGESWSFYIWYGRADIKVKVVEGKGVCEVRIGFPPLKLRELALKELEKKLSRYQSL